MKKWIRIIAFLSLLIIFVYLRLKPIINQTVPYTYDQGRDFLKAEEIVRFKNLTFIGPTTGIMGINHGAWWYYLLSIPYFIFNGWPMGFYYFMFFISLVGNLGFYYFLKKEFNLNTALLFLSIVSISPYFIPLSFFASNNIITPYIILFLIVSIYYLFKTKKYIWFFFLALSSGFVHEFEVSFGLFIIPIVIFLVLIFKNTRKILLSFKGFLYSFLGMIFAFSPRILFEVKHQFIQTKTLFNFFIKPKLHNPKPFIDVFNDRIIMFWSYFKSLFVNYNVWISAIILIGVMFIFFKFRKKLSNYPYLLMLILLASLLFLASLVYKDNFWSNYYEGIQYIFLFITLFAYYLISQRYKQISAIILLIYCFISLFIFSKELLNKEKLLRDFKAINQAVIYLYSQTKNKDFCLKIYTAPVIPYTYDYLTSYYSKIKNINRPVTDYLDNKCWFIIESDQYSFRVKEWIKENLPENGNKLTSHRINKDILIELWKK